MRQARNRSSYRFLGYISHVARFDVEATEIEWKATGIEEGNKQDRKKVKGENQKERIRNSCSVALGPGVGQRVSVDC